jgi:hypothetical protein
MSVTFSISYKSNWREIRDAQETGHGEVQFWRLPGNLDTSKFPTSPTTTITSSEQSSFVSSSYSIASQAFSGIDKRVLTIMPNENESGGGTILSQLPDPPLLVVLMRGSQETFIIWQFDRKSTLTNY